MITVGVWESGEYWGIQAFFARILFIWAFSFTPPKTRFVSHIVRVGDKCLFCYQQGKGLMSSVEFTHQSLG